MSVVSVSNVDLKEGSTSGGRKNTKTAGKLQHQGSTTSRGSEPGSRNGSRSPSVAASHYAASRRPSQLSVPESAAEEDAQEEAEDDGDDPLEEEEDVSETKDLASVEVERAHPTPEVQQVGKASAGDLEGLEGRAIRGSGESITSEAAHSQPQDEPKLDRIGVTGSTKDTFNK